ncbi:LacI family DNA-binding transcriptional regulator [Nesterenkonia sp. CL21]|uniref:LacI family DNA-binding transcriptional regulator n=1 Tax=Nesterenkonia sp. CL21 TaxID=3064894 RepID=UPI00287A013C|nr:LacI family DNA-binding transcriptional regulator [Nesterenkonia sp. CL21]MDS2172220.1 LacI family DNA-binding transcriptional regulator [Nesterenkonia sp. CL21]
MARAAGVSKSTVSRILDDRLPHSGSPNAQRVRRIAEELGYTRDVFASGLRQGRTNTVGVIVPRLTDTAMAVFFEAISHASDRRGRLAVVATTDHEPDGARRAVQNLVKRRVDGIIFAADRRDDPAHSWLEESEVPYVLALRSEGDGDAAVGDDVLGGYLATRHLLDLGHSSIALLTGPEFASNARLRQQGFREAMEEQGAEIDPVLVRATDFTVDSAAEAVHEMLDAGHGFSALFAATDNLAIGAMSALSRRGLTVPDDVSVVGYNDIPLSAHLPIPLTSVRVPFEEIAANALELLEAKIDHREVVRGVKVSTPSLIPRRSTRRVP